MSDKEIENALQNPAIIRNRLKIRAAVKNAIAFLKVQEKWEFFDLFIWSFTDGKIIHNSWEDLKEIPASTPLSDKVSNVLKKEGFSFVGSTICYALLQASGMINDHLVHCFRYKELIDG
jgi:DNA-3-methyladenine glycosylase I